MGHAHGDERDYRDGHHVPGRRNGVARRLDEGDGDKRRRAAEDGVGEVKGQREPGVAHLGGERLGQIARQRAVVDGEQKAHDELHDQDDREVLRVQQVERRHRKHDETHAGDDEHLLAAHLVGDAARKEDEGDVGHQADRRDERRGAGVVAHGVLQVVGQVGEHGVEAHGVQHASAEGHEQRPQVLGE